jgi:hypothetical protein
LPPHPTRSQGVSRALAAGINPFDAAGFDVASPDKSHIRRLCLGGIEQRQGEHIVAASGRVEILLVIRVGEIGDQQYESRMREEVGHLSQSG